MSAIDGSYLGLLGLLIDLLRRSSKFVHRPCMLYMSGNYFPPFCRARRATGIYVVDDHEVAYRTPTYRTSTGNQKQLMERSRTEHISITVLYV
jgi:hypothetical protein